MAWVVAAAALLTQPLDALRIISSVFYAGTGALLIVKPTLRAVRQAGALGLMVILVSTPALMDSSMAYFSGRAANLGASLLSICVLGLARRQRAFDPIEPKVEPEPIVEELEDWELLEAVQDREQRS